MNFKKFLMPIFCAMVIVHASLLSMKPRIPWTPYVAPSAAAAAPSSVAPSTEIPFQVVDWRSMMPSMTQQEPLVWTTQQLVPLALELRALQEEPIFAPQQPNVVPVASQPMRRSMWDPSAARLWAAGGGAFRPTPINLFRVTRPQFMSQTEALQTLSLAQGATEQEIKTAYRQAVAKAHPDVGGSTQMMQKVNEAREVLGSGLKSSAAGFSSDSTGDFTAGFTGDFGRWAREYAKTPEGKKANEDFAKFWKEMHEFEKAFWAKMDAKKRAPQEEFERKRAKYKKEYPVCYATEEGDLALVEKLVSEGFDVNVSDPDGRVPIFMAIARDRLDIVRALLRNNLNVADHAAQGIPVHRGVDVSVRNSEGRTPLNEVCYQISVMYLNLLRNDQIVDAQKNKGILSDPRFKNLFGMVDLLLEAKSDPNTIDFSRKEQFVSSFTKFDSNTIDPSRNELFFSPLLYAVDNNDTVLIDKLLQAGADPNLSGTIVTPLCLAGEKGYLESVKILLAAHADPNMHSSAVNQRDTTTPLLKTIQMSRFYRDHSAAFVEIVKALLDAGANPNESGASGASPLLLAIVGGDERLINLLLSKGAQLGNPNVNLGDWDKNTALHTAVIFNDNISDILDTLLKHGADINAVNHGGNTPLHAAVLANRLENVKVLLARGADTTIKNKKGLTAFDLAQKGNDPNIIEAFRSVGVRKNR